MKERKTRFSLLGCIMAMLLSFTLLIGTTFAWFTDSVSVVNTRLETRSGDQLGARPHGDRLSCRRKYGKREDEIQGRGESFGRSYVGVALCSGRSGGGSEWDRL